MLFLYLSIGPFGEARKENLTAFPERFATRKMS